MHFKKTLKKKGRAFQNIGNKKNIYIYVPDCKISLTSLVQEYKDYNVHGRG